MINTPDPRVVYISYDGVSEPLGQSQVIPYLERLSRTCELTLISFEKEAEADFETSDRLNQVGIKWFPCTYHRRPPLLSTFWDVFIGARTLRRVERRSKPNIVHVRGYVAALVAAVASLRRSGSWNLLFDIRGFWLDERVLAGAWSHESLLLRIGRRFERYFFSKADAIVTLTQASIPHLEELTHPRQVPVRVIPTCVEYDRFQNNMPNPTGPRAVWCGSIGSFYRFDLAVRFSDALGLPLLVLTPQVEAARRHLGSRKADVRKVSHYQVAAELNPGDIGMCFYADDYLGNLGRSPTRAAEYLSAGMILAVTPGIGDLDALISDHRVGVVVDDETPEALERKAREALTLAANPDVWVQGRRLAREVYSLSEGTAAYLSLYSELLSSPLSADAEHAGAHATSSLSP